MPKLTEIRDGDDIQDTPIIHIMRQSQKFGALASKEM